MVRKSEVKTNIKISSEDEVKVLRKIVDIASSEFDLDSTLKEIVKTISVLNRADSVFIYLYDQKKKNLVLMASKTPHKKELGKVVLKTGEGITGWVAMENKLVAIPKGAYQDLRFKEFDVLPEDQYEAFLSIPIIFKGKSVGVINVQHKKPHKHSSKTISLNKTIAKQIGGVLEHARLYDNAIQKVAQFDSLMKVSSSVISEQYLDEILDLIVVVTAEMLHSKICSIMLVDEKGEDLVIKATQSLSEEYKKKPNVRIDSSISGEALRQKKPIVVLDVTAEEKYYFRELAKKEELTSMVAVPMVVKDKAIGVVNVYTMDPHDFDQEEIDVLQIVSNQAAVAVENTKLMEETFKAKDALETRKLVERAKGILMKMNNLTEDAAYRLIHKKSMDSCKSMKEIAESVMLMDELK